MNGGVASSIKQTKSVLFMYIIIQINNNKEK